MLAAAGTAGAEDAEAAAAEVDWKPFVEEVHIKDASSASATGERAKPDVKGIKVGVISAFSKGTKESAATGLASFLKAIGSAGASVTEEVVIADVGGESITTAAEKAV